MQSWQVQDPLVAELAYRETLAARARVRAIRRAITFPLRLLALANLGGAVAALVLGRFHLGLYFGPAFLTVLVVSTWSYRRYATSNGLLLPARPWVLILLMTLAASVCASRLGVYLDKPWVSDFGPCVAHCVAIGLTALWLQSRRLGLTAAGMFASSAVTALLADGDLAVSLQLAAFGVLLWNAAADHPDPKEARA